MVIIVKLYRTYVYKQQINQCSMFNHRINEDIPWSRCCKVKSLFNDWIFSHWMRTFLVQWLNFLSLARDFTLQHREQGISSFIQWFFFQSFQSVQVYMYIFLALFSFISRHRMAVKHRKLLEEKMTEGKDQWHDVDSILISKVPWSTWCMLWWPRLAMLSTGIFFAWEGHIFPFTRWTMLTHTYTIRYWRKTKSHGQTVQQHAALCRTPSANKDSQTNDVRMRTLSVRD